MSQDFSSQGDQRQGDLSRKQAEAQSAHDRGELSPELKKLFDDYLGVRSQ
jgi:hypothetical protein